MRIEVTDNPSPDDEKFVVAQVRAFNLAFAERDFESLCVFARDNEGNIIGGLASWPHLLAVPLCRVPMGARREEEIRPRFQAHVGSRNHRPRAVAANTHSSTRLVFRPSVSINAWVIRSSVVSLDSAA